MRTINKPCEQRQYFGMALDPIHIGTGGYRLGRVDNTIVREPGTNIPKIPGTSLEGAARTFAYFQERAENSNAKINKACGLGKKIEKNEATIEPCGNCSVCVTFGFTTDENSRQGMVRFSDARVLFFPVHSMLGPIWITGPGILGEFGINENFPKDEKDKIKTSLIDAEDKLNLGWLYLENLGPISKSDDLKREIFSKFKNKDISEEMGSRLVLVSDKLFSQIVNSNLEVRTSVAIDPETGAAEEGALFTYEAIPRSTVFWFEVNYSDPEIFDAKIKKNGKLRDAKIEDVIETVKHGRDLFRTLGVGGMGTRGFGRLKILNGDENGE